MTDENPDGNAANSLSDALSAYKSIASEYDDGEKQVVETNVDLPLDDILALIPDQYLVDANAKHPDEKVSITIDDLYQQLRKGFVDVTIKELASHISASMLNEDAIKDETPIRLPLPLIVSAIDPSLLEKRVSHETQNYDLASLPDPFTRSPEKVSKEPAQTPASPIEEDKTEEPTASVIEPPEIDEIAPTVIEPPELEEISPPDIDIPAPASIETPQEEEKEEAPTDDITTPALPDEPDEAPAVPPAPPTVPDVPKLEKEEEEEIKPPAEPLGLKPIEEDKPEEPAELESHEPVSIAPPAVPGVADEAPEPPIAPYVADEAPVAPPAIPDVPDIPKLEEEEIKPPAMPDETDEASAVPGATDEATLKPLGLKPIEEIRREEPAELESHEPVSITPPAVPGVADEAPEPPVMSSVVDEVPAVPSETNEAQGDKEASSSSVDDIKAEHLAAFEKLGGINANTASASHMTAIPGIEIKLAESIVAYRESNGSFRDIFSLIDVPGLSRRVFKEITGMPFSPKKTHRAEKIAKLLNIDISQAGRVPEVVKGIAVAKGLEGCVVSDDEGLILAESQVGELVETICIIAPRMIQQMHENMRLVEVDDADFVSISLEGHIITIVHCGMVYLAVVHGGNKITQAQQSLIKKVSIELAWLLSDRLCVST